MTVSLAARAQSTEYQLTDVERTFDTNIVEVTPSGLKIVQPAASRLSSTFSRSAQLLAGDGL